MEKLVYDGLQPCPYRDGFVARMPLYRQLAPLDLDQTDLRLATAERRVGASLYHTACPTCSACEGLRVDVPAFTPNKSQRRAAARVAGRLQVEIGPAEVDERRAELMWRHKVQRGLGDAPAPDVAAYAAWLVRSCMLTIEMRYLLDGDLVGVGLVDLGADAASSVYFYFDPDRSREALGTVSVLEEVELCRRTGRRWLYLGLMVEDCRHLAYKTSFVPHQRRRGGIWK